MPVWAQIIIGISLLVTAIGVIWKKIIHPAAKFITTMDEAIPVMREMTIAFRGTPHALEVLAEIAKEFQPDTGMSLRDIVDKLETASVENQLMLSQLTIKVQQIAETGNRIETAAAATPFAADAAAQRTEKEKHGE